MSERYEVEFCPDLVPIRWKVTSADGYLMAVVFDEAVLAALNATEAGLLPSDALLHELSDTGIDAVAHAKSWIAGAYSRRGATRGYESDPTFRKLNELEALLVRLDALSKAGTQ